MMEGLQWLVLAAVLSPCLCDNNKLFVKFGLPSLDPLHIDSFFAMPRTRPLAESDGWALAEDRCDTDGYSILCRNNDYRVCLLMDLQGSVAGIQVSMSVDDVKRSATPYPMDLSLMQEKKRVLNTDVYAVTIMFVDDDVLKGGGRVLTDDTKTAPNGMYVLRRDTDPRYLPNAEDDLDETLYKKQTCIDFMGRHYFYNLTKEQECGDLENVFPIYCEWSHELIGFSYLVFGRSSLQKNGRRWFEPTAGSNFKIVAPDAPNCLSNWTDSFGMVALHVYTDPEPWNIHCSD